MKVIKWQDASQNYMRVYFRPEQSATLWVPQSGHSSVIFPTTQMNALILIQPRGYKIFHLDAEKSQDTLLGWVLTLWFLRWATSTAASEWALLPELVSYQTKQDFQSPSYRKLEKEKNPKCQEICKPQLLSSIIPHHGYYHVSSKVAHKS